jgi:predicted transcriptional regulator
MRERLTHEEVAELRKFKLRMEGYDCRIKAELAESLIKHLLVEKTPDGLYRLTALGEIIVNALSKD